MTIGSRIKEIRVSLAMSQKEFGSRIAVAQTYLSQIENGEREATDKIIMLIAQVFGANENWIRTGKGKAFPDPDPAEEVADFLGKALKDENSFKARFISALSRLNESDWEVIKKFAEDLQKKDDA
ncbi:helix-turn-helix domain-containing protein [Caproicibacterium sp. NSD3]